MSGPRVTSGAEAMQDGSTPVEFIGAVERRFGPIVFDLAAHRLNKKHARYFAPTAFQVKLERGKPFDPELRAQVLAGRGADYYEAKAALLGGVRALADSGKDRLVIEVANRDTEAVALDAFAQDWAAELASGLGWLNCEWADVTAWAEKCLAEMERGAHVLLLTHVAIADWARDLIFGRADVSLLSGRLCFDGKNVLPKDCMLSHFWPGATGRMDVWDWRRDVVAADWALAGRAATVVMQNPRARAAPAPTEAP